MAGRRGRGRGYVEQRGPTTFRLRAEGPRDPVTGERAQIRKTIQAPDKRAAGRELTTWLSELDNAKPKTGGAITVGEACERWLAWKRPRLVARAAEDYEGHIRRYIRPRLGEVALENLTTLHLDEFYDWMSAIGSSKAGPLAPGTVRKSHNVLHGTLDQAIRWGWITVNPAAAAGPPVVPKASIKPPASEEARALVADAQQRDPDWAAYLWLAAATGRRRAELCALRRSTVDVEAGTATICRVVELVADRPVVREYPKSPLAETGPRRSASHANPLVVKGPRHVVFRPAQKAGQGLHSLIPRAGLEVAPPAEE